MLIERDGLDVVELLGIRFLSVTEERCVELIVNESQAGRGGWVITPNLDILRLASQQSEIRSILERADVLVADGMPLIWASRMQGTPLPERVSGSHLISSLSAFAAANDRSLFLLGGANSTADDTAKILKSRHPSLRITGTHYPPFGFERDPEQMKAIEDALAANPADIVFVALTFPKGERLIEAVRHVLPAAWWVGVGISFSFISGDVAQAPVWMQKSGLEWFHRLIQEPRRLAGRYLVHDLPFAGRLFARAAARRLGADQGSR